jgi:hypothetical protein
MRCFFRVLWLSLGAWSALPAYAQSDQLDRYYAQASQKIKDLKNRSLDGALSSTERTAAAIELRALYPRETPSLWLAWLQDHSAPELAQLALTDMAGYLFASHYPLASHEETGHPATPDASANARELLRSLAAHSDQPEVRKVALDTLGSVADSVGLAALRDAVKEHVYEPASALRYLSAAPKVGAPLLADFATDSTLSMEIRLGAVRAMTRSPEYAGPLQMLALSAAVPPEIREEAMRSHFSVAPDAALNTAVAAIGSSKDRSQKEELVGIIADNATRLPANENTEQVLRQLSKELRAEHGGDRVPAEKLKGLDHAISDVAARESIQQ